MARPTAAQQAHIRDLAATRHIRMQRGRQARAARAADAAADPPLRSWWLELPDRATFDAVASQERTRMRWSRYGRAVVIAWIAAAFTACDLTINSTGGGGTATGGATVVPTSPTTPTSPTSPTSPTPPTGARTPDPPPGSFLPFPNYTQATVQQVTTPLGNPCIETSYLDSVVDRLRGFDTRWGYVCATDCTTARRDKIAYHATAGPDVTGALGVWIVDIITDACGPTQRPGFIVSNFEPLIAWSTRGRF